MIDRIAFRSDRLPTEHFNERFSDANLAFWVPRIVEAAQVQAGQRVLDVGCGTGGFARAIAEGTSASVIGVDRSAEFVAFATAQPAPRRGAVEWVVGDAEQLPFDDGVFDRVLLSLVLHQLPHPEAAVAEAFRVLVDGGLALVRTIAPEDVGERVPECYLPSMAAADRARMPAIEAVERWLVQSGFDLRQTRRVLRNKELSLADEERQLLVEVRCRYPFVGTDELDEGLRRMRADAEAHRGAWLDPRPTYFVLAAKR